VVFCYVNIYTKTTRVLVFSLVTWVAIEGEVDSEMKLVEFAPWSPVPISAMEMLTA
jgi:hypothetical protein